MKARTSIIFYLNGNRKEVSGDDAFLTTANYLRKVAHLTGTKIVCAEGDCGACSVLLSYPERKTVGPLFKVVNACIIPVYLLDGASLVSVEGLSQSDGSLSCVQKALVDCHGSQCGYCTPGFVAALSALADEKKAQKVESVNKQTVKNYCTGNLCRCTGYEPILYAGTQIKSSEWESLEKRYLTKKIIHDLKKVSKIAFQIESSTKRCFGPTKIADVSKLLKLHKNLRIVSAATDLGVVHNKERIDLYQTLTLHHVPELYEIKESSKSIRIGARVDLETLRLRLKKPIPVFADFLNIFASLQIRNFATLAGNIANASPVGDTLPFLFIMNAQKELVSTKGKRKVFITDFYKDYKKMDMKAGEWILAVEIPKPSPKAKIKLLKTSQRRDLDISTVNAAFYSDAKEHRIAYGGVGPTTLRLHKLEKFLNSEGMSEKTLHKALDELQKEIRPLSDVRGSKEFRMLLARNLFRKFAEESL